MSKLFFFIFLCISVHTLTQLDDKSAFKKLKKLQGIWLTKQDEEKIYLKCTIQNKKSLYLKKYKIQSLDTTLLSIATIYYSKFMRFNHPSSVHYNIQALDSDIVYSFRLEKTDRNTFTFSNFNNDFPNEIIIQLDGEKLTIKSISKDKLRKESSFYSRLR